MDITDLKATNSLSAEASSIASELSTSLKDAQIENKVKGDNHCVVSSASRLNQQSDLNERLGQEIQFNEDMNEKKLEDNTDLNCQNMNKDDDPLLKDSEILSTENENPLDKEIQFNEDIAEKELENNTDLNYKSEQNVLLNDEQMTQEETTEFQPISEIKIDYNFSDIPFQITGAWEPFSRLENYTKGCKWSPDGTCILTNSDDKMLRLFNLPPQFYEEPLRFDSFVEMSPVLSMKEAELVYDYCWYPKMSSSDPNTCFVVSCCASNPVHMWDAFTGQLHCTYRPYNNMDEVIPAYSLAFNQDGTKLYCGFNKMIKVFDVAIPGRDCISRPTKVKHEGQTGIISCIAVNPFDQSIYAAGSYSTTIGIYSEPKGKLMFMLQGQSGGLTHIKFSFGWKSFIQWRTKANQLQQMCRYRKNIPFLSSTLVDHEILCWDLRNPGEVLFSMKREVNTNQRIYFDIDPSDNYMVSGNHNGIINIWETGCLPMRENDTEIVLEPILQFQGHNDAVNGVSFHPTLPVLASCSGQRAGYDPSVDSDNEDDNNEAVFDNSMRL
ncbi:Telomerase Cajal body protein 1 [Nymphon striatum]|nr:Telomerase Cajal body protein 1 [Nymphon striatum]